ncbi:MAG TPA: hypothetical protein VFE34_14095 [Dongiaceae bacterium]|jgi:hypothetical protein|nr:hypothetical protein [Dongiaceae bacterium]
MVSYRWRIIDEKEHVTSVEAIDCTSDADAMVKAAQILERNPDAGAIEVWDRTRLVGRAPGVNGRASC